MTALRTPIKWLIALLAAAGLHLLAFQLLPQRENPVQQAGGRMQLQLGVDQAAMRRSPEPARSAPEAAPEPEETAAPAPAPAPETAPTTDSVPPRPDASIPEPEPQPRPEPRPEPDPQPPPKPEPKPRFQPEPEPESEPEPVPERASERSAMTKPAERSVAATDAQPAQAPNIDTYQGATGGDNRPEAREGEADAQDRARQAGNAASENYAGTVLRHLSQLRRPRASGPGTARVAFTVAADGSLERVEIAKTSGSGRFDRDALRMIERAVPFPEPPPGVNRDFTIEIEGR